MGHGPILYSTRTCAEAPGPEGKQLEQLLPRRAVRLRGEAPEGTRGYDMSGYNCRPQQWAEHALNGHEWRNMLITYN